MQSEAMQNGGGAARKHSGISIVHNAAPHPFFHNWLF
jgi:hypothetical protein